MRQFYSAEVPEQKSRNLNFVARHNAWLNPEMHICVSQIHFSLLRLNSARINLIHNTNTKALDDLIELHGGGFG